VFTLYFCISSNWKVKHTFAPWRTKTCRITFNENKSTLSHTPKQPQLVPLYTGKSVSCVEIHGDHVRPIRALTATDYDFK
jgi:hypothetical protein